MGVNARYNLRICIDLRNEQERVYLEMAILNDHLTVQPLLRLASHILVCCDLRSVHCHYTLDIKRCELAYMTRVRHHLQIPSQVGQPQVCQGISQRIAPLCTRPGIFALISDSIIEMIQI